MDIGERCVITMLIMGLLLSRADNLGIEKVTNNNGHKKCEGLLSAASAFLLTMYQFTSDLYRTDSKSEHVCCSTSASLYTRCNE